MRGGCCQPRSSAPLSARGAECGRGAWCNGTRFDVPRDQPIQFGRESGEESDGTGVSEHLEPRPQGDSRDPPGDLIDDWAGCRPDTSHPNEALRFAWEPTEPGLGNHRNMGMQSVSRCTENRPAST